MKLTPRETEVLGLLAEGMTNPEIAETLVISNSTVKFHVSSILGKLQADSRTEAVVYTFKHKKLIPPERLDPGRLEGLILPISPVV